MGNALSRPESKGVAAVAVALLLWQRLRKDGKKWQVAATVGAWILEDLLCLFARIPKWVPGCWKYCYQSDWTPETIHIDQI